MDWARPGWATIRYDTKRHDRRRADTYDVCCAVLGEMRRVGDGVGACLDRGNGRAVACQLLCKTRWYVCVAITLPSCMYVCM